MNDAKIEETRKEAYLEGVHDMYMTLMNGFNIASLLYAKDETQIRGILKHTKYELLKVEGLIDSAPGIKTYTINQVAELIASLVDIYPCDLYWIKEKSQFNEFCMRGKTDGKYCKHKAYDCWLNALKEGWLNELLEE